jgi:hypothetical protein
VRIVFLDGTDDASRNKVLGSVVTYLAIKGFAVEVSPLATDVFILTAESAPRIGELLHPAEPHRIRAKAVRFELALVRPTTPPPPPPPPPGGEGSEGRD